MAFDITPDKDHKFELAIQLNRIQEASEIAEQQESQEKWKKVGDIALINGSFTLAEECFLKSDDFNSLFLFYSSYGDPEGLRKLVESAQAAGKYNVAYEAAFVLQDTDKCLEILKKAKKIPEAVLFARAYCPSKVEDLMGEWGGLLKQKNLAFQP